MTAEEKRYEKIKNLEFGVGSKEQVELLAKQIIPEELLIVALTHDTDEMYLIQSNGMELVPPVYRRIIQGGMFPEIDGNIHPKFRLIRVDLPTILAVAANYQKEQNKIKEANGIPLPTLAEIKDGEIEEAIQEATGAKKSVEKKVASKTKRATTSKPKTTKKSSVKKAASTSKRKSATKTKDGDAK